MSKKKNKKKSLNQLDIFKGLRKFWIRNPVTKIKPNKKKKNRAQLKHAFRKDIKDV